MDYIAVGIAGFLGAICRGVLGNILIFKDNIFPINTLFINLTGSFILSFFLSITLERSKINPTLRIAFSTGFLGAYTTFSTYALETVKLIKNGNFFSALLYLAISTAGGLIFAWLGFALSKYIINYHTKDKSTKEVNHE